MRWFLSILFSTAVFAVFLVVLWRVPWWLDSIELGRLNEAAPKATVVSGFRAAIAALLVASAAAVGLVFTARTIRLNRDALEHTRSQDRKQLSLTRDGQLNDRYSRAVGQLASKELTEQMGGIYALEHIMRVSGRAHPTVVEVLAAFVRQHAPAVRGGRRQHRHRRVRPPEHVKAALTVLSRRPVRDEPFRLDLRRTDLRGAYLEYARLEGANLGQARLEGAFLKGCQLQGAWLGGACLDGADLEGADLEGADLAGADMKNALRLTKDQVLAARPTRSTILPRRISGKPDVVARKAEVESGQVSVHFLRAYADSREVLPLASMEEARHRWLHP